MKKAGPLSVAILLFATQAQASEIFAGAYVHDVDTCFSLSGQEEGVDIQLGWRGDRIEKLRFIGAPQPHVFASVNSAGGTNFAAAGISWKIGRRFYARPGIGIAVHDGPGGNGWSSKHIHLGSRVVFAPELGFGIRASERVSIEASWVHLSHATLFGHQNPGNDNFGLRLSYRLGASH